MAAKSNYFKESGFHTWRFHSVGKRKHLLQLRLAARGLLHLQSPAMRPVVRVLPAFAALLVSSAFAQQPTPILPDSRLTPGDTFDLIPLELGGSNSVKNLLPESYRTSRWNARVKDRLERQAS
jgi:hypothetical protein